MSNFPNGWAETKLGNTISLNYGKSLPATVRDGGQFAVFGSNGVVGHHSEAITSYPAIIVGRKGSFGEVHFSEEACFPIDTTYYVDAFSTLDARFAFHLLRHLPLTEMNRASAIPGLNREDAYGLDVALPPLAEQRRIVAKVDGLTARTARARKELDRIPTLIARYKQRLLALAFSGELTAGWRDDHGLREPVPTTVYDLSNGLRYGTAQKSYAEPNGVAVLRIPNVASGRISLEDLKYSQLEPRELAKLRLIEGDILVVRSNGSVDLVGRPALVTGDAVGLAYAGYLIRIRPKHDVVMPKFLTLMLEAPAIRSIIEAGARSTSGVNNVNATELGALTVPLFDIDEQAEIVRRIESAFGWLDRMTTDHAAAARLLPKLDAAVLAKAFAGNLVPQDPNDEPASALLERIKAEREAAPKVKRGKQVSKIRSTKDLQIMAQNLEQVLAEAGDWISAQDAFQKCGIGGAATTEEIEKVYAELRKLDKAGRIEAEPVNDDHGRKLHDRLRLKVA